ncbi:cystathionine gamma-synthase [Pullulanibacillus camelliae]|uniref:Cystathionine gamma-synthase n=1 Tax=Pullulanibacillus camelliae TaxID=1707096 RepID=A0A8J2VMB1_9BACL|nr:methionine biosynthesis PLP-dependent protein [Pullulanibacillus camelliae]GGE28479.1 cystathionine gamma-synthase [Pullulanibacillus camelliae]
MTDIKLETLLAQIGNQRDHATGAISPPIHLSTAYRHEGLGRSTGYDYTRTGNPTRDALEEAIAALESGKKGFAFSSGMAAVQAVFSLFSSGDEVLTSSDLYGGTYRLLEMATAHGHFSFRSTESDEIEAFRAALRPATKAIFIETPSNPLMKKIDIEALVQLTKERELLLIVDNTFYTPIIQQPLTLGADIVLHSATKYLGGHNDVLAGLLVTNREDIAEKLGLYQNAAGAVLAPFDCWLLMRGMKTLALRMRQHESNAQALTAFLSAHEAVSEVLYPGRGGMISFRVKDEKQVAPLLENLHVVTFAESLGGVESFITYPATQTHAEIPEEIRIQKGVCNRLLRLSVGIENSEDLIRDLDRALKLTLEKQEVQH